MSPKVGKWLVISASALAVIVLTVFALLFGAATGWLNHIYPPALASGVITDEDWLEWEPAGRKLTTVLQKRFPTGTPVSTMRDALIAEGFKAPPHEQSCETTVDVNRNSTTRCRYPADINRRLEYIWGIFPCSQSVAVTWREDRQRRIATLAAYYGGGCL